MFCNSVFWQVYAGVGGMAASGGWMTAISLFVAVTGLNMLLLCIVLNRWTAKPLLTAFAVYYMDADMIRNVLHTESKELITPGLILPLLLYAVLPIALVWRVRLRKRPLGQALLRRAAMMLAALLITAGATLLSFQDISALMRKHKDIRHLITPVNYLVSLAASHRTTPRRQGFVLPLLA